MQTLRLQAAPGDREVDEGHARAKVGRELDGGVARRQKHGEHRRKVDFLVAQLDQAAALGVPNLAVQHRAHDGVVILHVLDQEGPAKAQRQLQVLAERAVQEVGHNYIALFVHVGDELGGHVRRVDDQRVAVEALEHDRVLNAQVVGGQGGGSPEHALVGAAQVLNGRQVLLELDIGVAEDGKPGGEVHAALGLFVEAGVGHERRAEQHVADDRGHLEFKGLAAGFPARLLAREALEQGHGPLHL